jgi:hypothetical protein
MKILNKNNKGGLWTAQFGELVASLAVLERAGLTPEMMKQLRGKGGEEKAKKIIANFLEAVSLEVNYEALRTEWQNFYDKYFNLKVDLSGIKIPTPRTDFKRLLIIIPGISPNSVVAVQRKHFETDVYPEDFDRAIMHNDRDASNGPYAIWVRDTVEPDKKYHKKKYHKRSVVNWAKDDQVSGETLLERLIHGLKYWDEKKKHLDVNGITLCTGSRDSYHDVPGVDFHSDNFRVRVRWYDPDDVSSCRGLHEIVSCAEA